MFKKFRQLHIDEPGRNWSPWSGEPWANHGEPDHGKSGKCPELRDGREVSAGVRVDLEIPGSMA